MSPLKRQERGQTRFTFISGANYGNHHSVEEVVDPQVIERLENEDPPETDAYVDRPLSPDEIKHLEDTGRL